MRSGLSRRQLYCSSGGVVGVIIEVMGVADDVTAEWLVVDPGVMRPHRLVPARLVTEEHGKLAVPFTLEDVEACPVVADGRQLDPPTIELLNRHYGLVPG